MGDSFPPAEERNENDEGEMEGETKEMFVDPSFPRLALFESYT